MSLHKLLGFRPKNVYYYQRAFTHASLHKKDQFGKNLNYERLEFLGDSVLGSVVSAYLYNKLPQADEGQLTKMRSKLVSRNYLNQLGQDFQLIRFMETPVHQEQFGENIYGNLFEALIGAIYQDKGYKCCKDFIQQKVIEPHVDLQQLKGKILSYKSHLIEWCQKEKYSFEFISKANKDEKSSINFVVDLQISGETVSKACSTSKKKAEEKAAKLAYLLLKQKIDR